MNVVFANSKNSVETPVIRLKEVYCLETDNTYHPYKNANKNLSGYVIIRTMSGHGRIHVKGLPEMDLEPATLLMIKHNLIIDYHPYDNKWDFWWFAFDLDGLCMLPLNEKLNLPCLQEEENFMKCTLIYLQNIAQISQLAASSYMCLLIGYWSNHIKLTQPCFYKNDMDNILRYIHSHLDNAPSVGDMAQICGLSSRQFYNVFLETNKTSPQNYILRLRMEKGSYLLLNTNKTVFEIACMTGYSDQFYFSRVFKNYFGSSPQYYRKEQGKTSGK